MRRYEWNISVLQAVIEDGADYLPLLLPCLYSEGDAVFFGGHGAAADRIVGAIGVCGEIEVYLH